MPQNYSSNPRDINIASPGVTQGEMLARLQQALLQQQIDDAELSGPAAKAARTQMRLSDPIEAMNTQDQIRRFSIRRDIAPQPIKGVRAAPVSMNPADFPMAGARGAVTPPPGMPVLRGVRRVTEGEPAAPKPVTTAFGTSTPRTTARSFGTGGLSDLRETADAMKDPNYGAGLQADYDRALNNPAVIAAGVRGQTARDLAGNKPIPPAIQGAIRDIDASLHSLDKLEALSPRVQGSMGPVAGRMASFAQNLPGGAVNPDFAEFQAETAAMKNATIKAITGAGLSNTEAERIMQQIPLETDKPEVWKQKAKATRDNQEYVRRRTYELLGRAAPDAGQMMDTAGPSQAAPPGAVATSGRGGGADPLGIR